MALYRNVAGAEALGLVQDAYFVKYDENTWDGGGGEVSPQPYNTDYAPIRSVDPVEQPDTSQVYYDPWYVPVVPPTVAPEPVVEQPPPDHVYVTPTGATVVPELRYPRLDPVFKPVTLPSVEPQPISDTPRVPITNNNTAQALTQNLWPLLVLAGVVIVAVKGEDLLHNRRHIAFAGGLAALYYLMQKNIKVSPTD